MIKKRVIKTHHLVDKKPEVSEVDLKKNKKKNIFNPITYFLSFALALGIGYLIGGHSNQIKALILPLFGYKNYSANIDLSSVENTYTELASRYDGDIDVKALVEGANKGLVEAVGDVYTTYMSSSEAFDYNNDLDGNIGGGIGAVIGIKNDQVSIISVLDDNPAIKSGLKGGDAILEINDESTSGMSVDIAVSKIRGEAGTTVKLLVARNGEQQTYNVTRDIINNPSVISRVEDGVGIMTISRFDDSTEKLARLVAKGFIKDGVKGVILDLRGNPGGYVNASIDVAGLWLDNKIVVTERRDGKIIESLKSGTTPILNGIKTVVLVNGGSASASEIVAGALQDWGVAEIVGENTYGKGSVQQLIPLNNGAQLKVTIAKWYTPKGKNITSEGIVPDYAVSLSQEDFDKDIDTQFDKAFSLINY